MSEDESPDKALALEQMERFAAPENFLAPDDPKLQRGPLTGPIDLSRPGALSLAKVAQHWAKSCAGGDNSAWENNCAHFLSDAFIRAGYIELTIDNPHIDGGGRCATTAKRPLRARNMWSWFKSKAAKSSTKLEKDTGWWAVFQLDEAEYWGGHVVLVNADDWKAYGTGWFGSWRGQYLYQW